MPLPRKQKKYYELTRIEKAIAVFCWHEKPTQGDLNMVGVEAQIQEGIEKYQADAQGMTQDQLEQEAHDSQRLGAYMSVTGDPLPHRLCDAHAIVSGAHPWGAKARAVLAWHKVRIDDYINGCWLPRNTDAKKHMPSWLIGAVPHSRIHRWYYYQWVNGVINIKLIKDKNHLITELKNIEFQLQTSTFGPSVMKYKGQK